MLWQQLQPKQLNSAGIFTARFCSSCYLWRLPCRFGRPSALPRSSCLSGRAPCRCRWWAKSCFSGIDAFALTAVPLFILTGDVLVRTGLSRKFLDVAEALTQLAKGGFGSATVLVCGMFAAISGSDAAGAAAVGRMTIDRLVESGYPRPYACALVAAGACTGILIPPSIAYIIIGLVLGISASTLFLAAVIPGIAILVSILAPTSS
jgi:C4-dicarboxylate transporter DctM subunit